MPDPIVYQSMTILFALLAALLYGDARHWRAKAQALENQDNKTEGWQSECLFWRRHFNADAAEWTEEQG